MYVGRSEGKENLLLYKWLWIVNVSQAPWIYIQKILQNKLIAQIIKGLNWDLTLFFFFSGGESVQTYLDSRHNTIIFLNNISINVSKEKTLERYTFTIRFFLTHILPVNYAKTW